MSKFLLNKGHWWPSCCSLWWPMEVCRIPDHPSQFTAQFSSHSLSWGLTGFLNVPRTYQAVAFLLTVSLPKILVPFPFINDFFRSSRTQSKYLLWESSLIIHHMKEATVFSCIILPSLSLHFNTYHRCSHYCFSRQCIPITKQSNH